MATKEVTPHTKDDRRLLTKYEEAHPFLAFRDAMDRIMGSFFRGFDLEPFEKRQGIFSPNVDVTDTEKAIRVSAELPGIDEKDVEVTLTKDALTIKGEKKEEKEEKGKSYHLMERSYGSFIRTIPLPVEVETDKVQATFKKGLLTVTLPKTEKVIKGTKKVPIQSE